LTPTEQLRNDNSRDKEERSVVGEAAGGMADHAPLTDDEAKVKKKRTS